MIQPHTSELDSWIHLVETIRRLRAPGGCPWDRAQTHLSLRPHLIEEAYEVLDAIDQIQTDQDLKKPPVRNAFREELGDLLMQILLHSQIASEAEAFNIYDVAQALNEKLIRRHPHVFADASASTADEALQSWNKSKMKEKASQPKASVLDGVPKGLPTLQKAARIIEKVTQSGFQWNDLQEPLNKVNEELNELKKEIIDFEAHTKANQDTADLKKKIEAEMGDLLFSLCNLSYLLKINPEDALRTMLKRFEKRFRHVEVRVKEQENPNSPSLTEMDHYWNEAKLLEKTAVWGLTGGIASGKSTAAKIFIQAGIPVIDADQIAKKLIQPGQPGHAPVFERFGTVDSTQLRTIVFSDPNARKDLEAILHPLIQIESRRQILKLANQHSLIIYEAALLVETKRYQDLAGLIVVAAPEEIRLTRLLERQNMSPELGQKMMHSQTTDTERKQVAHVILENGTTLEHLEEQIRSFLKLPPNTAD